MIRADTAVLELLEKRRQAGLLRRLKKPENLLDFCSNDYLGLARSESVRDTIAQAVARHPTWLNGATGSRLLAG
ncbi:MAG: 8-amino-7-oxononanoate synthase, partial [Sphingobacteriales bacterium]